MISNELLKSKILDLAFAGELVNNVDSNKYLYDISNSYEKFNGGNRIKYEKSLDEFKYKIPINWKWFRLEDICDTFGRIGFRGYTKSDLVDSKNEGAISLSPSNIVNSKLDYSVCTYITWNKYNESPEIKVKNGDILLVKTASIGKNAIVENLPHEATINPQFALLKNIKCEKKYLYYYLNTTLAKKHYNKFAIGTSVPTFSQGKINSMLIPLAPLDEQDAIANKIDELFELIDKKEKNDQEKEKLKDVLKNKILDNAFNGTLTDSNNSNAWKNVVFSDVVDVRDGTHDSPKYVEYSDYPLITSKNLTNKGLDFSNVNYLKEEDYNLINQRSYVDDGDVLFAMIGSIGNPVLVNKNRNFAIKNVALFKCKSEIYNKFLYYFLLHEKDMKDKTKGGVQKFVSLKILRSYPIKLPPLEEQKKIVEKIESLFELIEQL